MWREPSTGDFVSYDWPHKNEAKMERQYTEGNKRKVHSCVLAFGTNLQKCRGKGLFCADTSKTLCKL